ncbi:MAG: phosphate regulon sensor histidine kinase PhoR [Hyphomicrobiales bacterium]|nr:phosphate regulon sensor histidine kinase PhoR [Hyphomicrobiales bacterium]
MAERETKETAPPPKAKQGETGPFLAGLDALIAAAARQKWVIAAASLVALLAALSGAVPVSAAAAGWVLVVIAALVAPARVPELPEKSSASFDMARPAPTAPMAPALISVIPDPCLLLSADGRILNHNAAASELFGRIVAGRPVSAVLRAPEIAAALRQAQQGGDAVRVDYFERVPIDRWFEAHIAPIHGAERPGAAFLLLLHDLTKQQRVERMRVDFIANASHELRTPLASLAGFIETLQGSARDDPKARARFLDIMRAQAQRMSRLVDDLLSLSRIELNAHIRPSAQTDLAAVVASVADSLTPLAAAAGVKIELSRPDAPVLVVGEREELTQVFQNLIENAIKYGAEGDRIEVTLDPAVGAGKGEVAVSVRDYGPGIAAEHLPRLTERFYRVDVASSREKGGTGLGLAIVKHILNRHRGSMQIASVPGEGATFTVRLNLADNAGGRDKPAAG